MKTLAILFTLLIAVSSLQAQKSSAPVLIPISENGFDALRAKSKGRILVLNFWATWCLPCIAEFPELQKLDRMYRRKGLDVIFISIDDDAQAKQKVMAFLTKMKVSGRSYIKESDNDEAFINAVNPKWSGALPATLIYDSSGRLTQMIVEQANYFELEKIVLPLLSR